MNDTTDDTVGERGEGEEAQAQADPAFSKGQEFCLQQLQPVTHLR